MVGDEFKKRVVCFSSPTIWVCLPIRFGVLACHRPNFFDTSVESEETKTPDAFLRADRCDLAEPSPSRAKARRATGEPALGAHLPKRDSLPP